MEKNKRIFCGKCNTITDHILVLPSRERSGNKYVSICVVCFSASSAFLEEENSSYVTFFCSSWQCKMKVRGKIIKKKGTQKGFDVCLAECPLCGAFQELTIQK